MLPSLSLASASAFVVSPTRMPAHAAPRLGAVRCEPSLFNFGMGADVVKIQFIQRLFTDFVGFDGGAQFEVEDDYVTQANHSATLLLKPDRTPAETASLVPFVTAQFLSIHSIDTRTSNVEVHHRAFMRRPRYLPPLPVCLSTPSIPTSDPPHPLAGEGFRPGVVAEVWRRLPGPCGCRPARVQGEVRRDPLPVVACGHRCPSRTTGCLRGSKALAHDERARDVQEEARVVSKQGCSLCVRSFLSSVYEDES